MRSFLKTTVCLDTLKLNDVIGKGGTRTVVRISNSASTILNAESMNDDMVLITGGSQGIGAGIASHLSEEGYGVIVLDVAEPSTDFAGIYYNVDLSNREATRDALRAVTNRYVVTRLVNNVGIVRPAPLEETRPEDFEMVIRLNAQSAMMCVQALLPGMRSAHFGRVVSITSRVVLGKMLRTAYSASKGALAAMTRTWSLELAGDGITVNAVAPGPIETDAFKRNNPPGSPRTAAIVEAVPVQRLGTPADVAHAARFFLDERSGFITGQTLYVCGGLTVGLAGAV